MIGKPIRRVEDVRFLTGRGNFVDDIHIPGTLYLGVVRSPFPRAKFKLITKGDRRILTFDDVKNFLPFPNFFFRGAPREYVLPKEVANYVGEPVALVLARDRYDLEDITESVDVEWDPLPPLIEPEKSISSEPIHEGVPNLIYNDVFTYGEKPEGDFIEKTFRYNRNSPAPIEPNAVLANYDNEKLTLYANTQLPQVFRTALSIILNIPRSKIRIIVPDSGGGFGGKIYLRPLAMAAVASFLTRRPVKYVETRTEHISAAVHGPDRKYRARIYYEGQRITGLEVELLEDFGAYMHTYQPLPILRQIYHLTGAYNVKGLTFMVKGVLTNKPPTGPYRGLGIPPAVLVLENLVSSLARTLGISQEEIRLKNFIRELPFTTITGAIYDSGDYSRALKLLSDNVNERGKGIAFALEPGSSLAFQTLVVDKPRTPYYEGVYIKIDSGGDVVVYMSSNSVGTGHETSIYQVVSSVLGVEDITIKLGDTDGPPGTGFYGSRFAVVGISAVYEASLKMRDKLLDLASKVLNVERKTLSLENGWVKVNGERRISVKELANIAYNRPGYFFPLEVSHTINSQNVNVVDDLRRVNFSTTYGVNAHLAVIELLEDYRISIKRYRIVSDAGRMINPMIVDGQLMGGTMMGIGAATLEMIRYNDDGIPLATNFGDYAIPSAVESVNFEIEHLTSPSPYTPLGTKGVAEGGATVPPAAIVNALEDYLDCVIKDVEVPITPEYVMKVVESCKKSRI
ncbi:carbon monoxide dehydrogenase [Sulfolobales archaeon HS-7]|nr:carbon monoxide dehydrogenase [Sulfolobales archaeon HS-7]